MSFEHYWVLLAKQWKLILGCFLLAGLGAYVVSRLMTPQYQSNVLVQVAIRSQNSQADINSLLASDQLVQTESQLAASDSVLREVASHQKNLTVEQLYRQVASTPKLNTQLFEITVLDPSPKRAARIANDIAQTLIKQQLQVSLQENGQSQQQIQQELDTTRQQIQSLNAKIAKGGSQGSAEQTQVNDLQQHYNQWQSALAQLELTQAQNGSFLRIAQLAQPGIDPVRPNVLLNTTIGLIVGLFLGILLAVLFEQLDTRVRTPEAITQLVGWSVLGTIWRTQASQRTEAINPQGRDANVEAYRILRTNVGFAGIDEPLHTLMVTSAMPGDGKSTIAANLAIFMAKAGKNTLLVDADLRRPVQHQIFHLPADKKGLSNAVMACSMPQISNSSPLIQTEVPTSPMRVTSTKTSTAPAFTLEPYVHNVGIPNLRVIPSGPLPPNPSELLDSKAMQRFFEAIASSGAEIVIFDAPPIRGISDASIMASRVDGTLVAVDTTRANKGTLKQVKTILTQSGAHVIGCVVNKQRRSRDDSSYSYYYYYRHQDEQDADGHNGAKEAEPTNMLHTARNAVKVALLDNGKGGQRKNGR